MIHLHFHAERIGKRLDGMLGGGIHPLQHQGPVRQCAADVNDRPGLIVRFEVPRRFQSSIHQSPEIGLEQSPHIFDRLIQEPSVHRHARVIDPGVEPSEHLSRNT